MTKTGHMRKWYPASCLEEVGEKQKTLSQENHFPPEIQTRYATNTSQKYYSFSQLVSAHAQNFYLYLWTEYSNIFGFTNSTCMYKHAHYSHIPLLKCSKYKLCNKFVHMYLIRCTKHFQENILPVTSFITYMKHLPCGRITICKPKMELTDIPYIIPDHSSHSNPEI
jgi:hypothetical protein